MISCNLPYNRNDHYRSLENIVNIIDMSVKFKRIKPSQVSDEFKKLISQRNLKIDLEANSDELLKDIQNILAEKYGRIEDLKGDQLGVYEGLIRAFLDVNTVERLIKPQQNTDAETDQQIIARLDESLDEAILSVYGINNMSLRDNVTVKFKKELKTRLIVDPNKALKHNLTTDAVNEEIVKFKERKFNFILNFLKNKFPGDTRLNNIKGMYSSGILNYTDYLYVLNQFKKYIDSISDLSEQLNRELIRINLQEDRSAQLEKYQELITEVIEKVPVLNTWFIKEFGHNKKIQLGVRERILQTLFKSDNFSEYYNVIKDKLINFINTYNTSDPDIIKKKKTIKSNIEFIEKPNSEGILEYVDSYFMLTRFDDLVNFALRENVKIDSKNYVLNSEPKKQKNTKYLVHDSHKHQKAGFESGNNEGSEVHTSSNVKDLLETISLYDYKSGNMIPKPLTLTLLNEAWQTLVYDFLENGTTFNTERTDDPKGTLKMLLSTQSDDVLGNVIKIFELLFEPKYGYKLIDKIEGSVLLNDNHKNILYSFYTQVLQNTEENRSSFLAKEMERMNNHKGGSLDIVNDLVAILQRNVSNNFLDTDLKKGEIRIQPKFNWDSNVFDLVERIQTRNRLRQLARDESNPYLKMLESNPNNSIKMTFTIGDKTRTLGFWWDNKRTGIFSRAIRFSRVLDNGVDYLNKLAEIDLIEFASKDKSKFTENEMLLEKFLTFLSNQMDFDFLSETGLKTLHYYKINYKEDRSNYIQSSNYLDELFKISLRLLEAIRVNVEADSKNLSLEQYLSLNESDYNAIYNEHKKEGKSNIFEFEGTTVLFKPVNAQNLALNNLVKQEMLVKGESIKSTTMNKQGSMVSNYSVSRAGSKLYQRLYEQRQNEGPASSLLFVKRDDLLDMDPTIDGEITTHLGEVKTVQELSENELFKHSILDKFYLSYINTGKICFQPTTYSDKTQFLNWFSKLSCFADDVMDLTKDYTEAFIDEYQGSFFNVHDKILNSVYNKIEKLMAFQGFVSTATGRFAKVSEFLKNYTEESLLELVKQYNQQSEEKLELEKDKDYRVVGKPGSDLLSGYCTINETLYTYASLAANRKALVEYLNKQLNLFVSDLEYYGTTFKVFDSKAEYDKWINGGDVKTNQLLKILSDKNILSKDDRKAFAEKWISTTGELILRINDEVNPLLRNYFYIEGMFSNNLRLSLSGSEINHPDKSDTVFKQIHGKNVAYIRAKNKLSLNPSDSKLIEEFNKTKSDLKVQLQNLGSEVINDSLTDEEFDLIVEEFSNQFSKKGLIEISKYAHENITTAVGQLFQEIYDQSLQIIINTSEGTQFKRNVIITATLANPLTGFINGTASVVKTAVIYDTQAPVANLRYSKSIDAQDGSARISAIQLRLENNSLGDQKVGVNRKPIWDAQTEDLTSFLAKFAAFGITIDSMKKSAKSASSDLLLFKKMHNERWNQSVNLTKNIYQVENSKQPTDVEVNNWFKTTILEGKRLYYKNAFGDIIEITGFGIDKSGHYYTKEKLVFGGEEEQTVYHYFDEKSKNHYTEYQEGLHTIDSLYELFISLGGIECVNRDGSLSEFSLDVLTNFVINVGHKKSKGNVLSEKDVVQPLKDKFIAYVFNNSAVKNGAKNINPESRWRDDEELNTFRVSVKGLGIQLNADHSVVNQELTEFSQVIAACAAYGKYFSNVNELYYSLALSAFQASEKELENIKIYLENVRENSEESKYKLYLLVGKLILQSKSNSKFDLTNAIKQGVQQIIKNNKNIANEDDLKIPFSDPSLYQQFITSITSVINGKSIKRKHPGSQYVLSPAYNVIQYFQIYDKTKNQYKKYMYQDVLDEARDILKNKLRERISVYYATNGLNLNDKYIFGINSVSLSNLVKDATELGLTEDLLELSVNFQDVTNANNYLVSLYLEELQKEEVQRTKEWFLPTDIVLVQEPNKPAYSLDLSKMEDFYKFKDRKFEEGTIFKLDVTKPNNLKPSLVRWQYQVDKVTGEPVTSTTLPENIETRYMTLYDHYIVKSFWNKPKNQRPTQMQIQEVLDQLEKGKFTLVKGGPEIDIIPGTLENTEAELVLGNMYKEQFNIKNHSLAYVLNQGENYFKQNIEVPQIPAGFYHMAMIKTNGEHVLISIDKVVQEGTSAYQDRLSLLVEDPFSDIYEQPDSKNKNIIEIYNKKGGIKIGRYVITNRFKSEDGKTVIDSNGNVVDKSKYKLVLNKNGGVEKIYERIDYITRYKYMASTKIGGEDQFVPYTFYKITNLNEIARSFSNYGDLSSLSEEVQKKLINDASNQIQNILYNLYEQDTFTEIRINKGHPNIAGDTETAKKVRATLATYLTKLGNTTKQIKDKDGKITYKQMTEDEIKALPAFEQNIIDIRNALMGITSDGEPSDEDFSERYKGIIDRYYKVLAHPKKKYASFLSSLYFISSRIPAQSLQSFMPMKCIGWTSDDNNTAYVSYIQTFLQGSDYDIDKAYIMGQSFDDSVYVGWSNLFDYSTVETLQASKTLPIPRNDLQMQQVIDRSFSIDNELQQIVLELDPAQRMRKLAKLIHKINDNNGKYSIQTTNPEFERIINQIKKHQQYKIPYSKREAAYKNVASANIFEIVHSIRNRDQAYSDITMSDLQEQADASPKGKRIKQLNMINPLTKYIMQYQNLVGKEVIGIAANGEKDWFNLTYYYHNILRKGTAKDLTYLTMDHTFSRIQGRSKGRPVETKVNHIPDIGNVDKQLTRKLRTLFYKETDLEKGIDDKYVDQLISQLLSAATDNAKELILARINGGTKLAKYHIHLMMLGFSLDDIVSFMTSPVIELLDHYSKSDFYNNVQNKVSIAQSLLKGRLKLSSIIRSEHDIKVNELDEDQIADYLDYIAEKAEAEAERDAELATMMDESGKKIKIANDYEWIRRELKYNNGTKTVNLLKYLDPEMSLQDFIQLYILSKVGLTGKDMLELELINVNHYRTKEQQEKLDKMVDILSKYTLPETSNFNTNYFFKYVNTLITKINQELNQYNENHFDQLTIKDFYLDLNEFDILTKQANESSTLASVWLKLNQGIPQTDEELIKLINRMTASITTREKDMGIKRLFNYKSKFITLNESKEQQEQEEKDKEARKNALLEAVAELRKISNIAQYDGVTTENNTVKELFNVVKNILENNPSLNTDYIFNVLQNSIETEIYGNFDLYKFLANERVYLEENGFNFNSRIKGMNTVSYRELAADYYNLIKSSWNILDMVSRIPTYEKNIDLLNYTLQQRHLFANKAKLLDDLLRLGGISVYNLSQREYKKIIDYSDKIIIASYFFKLSEKNIILPEELSHAKVYSSNYGLEDSKGVIDISTLNGIDSLKYFVETYLLDYLQKNYADNDFVKELTVSSIFGKQVIRTKLDLSKIEDSMSNKMTFSKARIGFAKLMQEKTFGEYSIGDIIMLYNLALHGTKLSGKYLTAMFVDSITPNSVLYDYYFTTAKDDYKSDVYFQLPTKKDLLIHLAPMVRSKAALQFRTEPYVKVYDMLTGFKVYKQVVKNGEITYDALPETMLTFNESLNEEEKNIRLYNYSNSLMMFPELHGRIIENSIYTDDSPETIQRRKQTLIDALIKYTRQNRLLIDLKCD